VVGSALAKDPSDRPDSAAGFAASLRAAVEGSGTLLRQAVSLYSEHFPTFLKVSLISYSPLLLVIAWLQLAETIFPIERLTPVIQAFFGPLIVFTMIAANLLAYAITSAATVPVVVQLMIAPLRPVRTRTAFAALARRWQAFAVTSLAVFGLILAGSALFLLPGVIIGICFALYAPVAVMEHGGVRKTLRRAFRLMRRSPATVLIITLLQFTLPVLVWIASIETDFVFRMDESYNPKQISFNLSVSEASVRYQLLNIFVTPLTAIMTALLYLKTRWAGGESLKGAIEEFDAIEIPASKWQARMRSRLLSTSSSTRN
jgi:hypothetical protein